MNQTFNHIIGDHYEYDLRQKAPGHFPPEFYTSYLDLPEVKARIGATSIYNECSDSVNQMFNKTGDVSTVF